MDTIGRRALLFLACAGRYSFGQTSDSVSGRLLQTDGQACLRLADGRAVRVSGDAPTDKILHDARLNSRVFEARGNWQGAEAFTIDPIETRPMVVVDGAKRWRVTYYCDVCSIRTYSPGPCMCCQAETRLDLIDPATKD